MSATTYGPEPTSIYERVWRHINVKGPDECWLWTGSTFPNGYGRIRIGPEGAGRRVAHRVAYESVHGPVPDDLVIDHVRDRGCTSRLCCNPAHLEAVTNAENVRRGRTAEANRERGRSVTHCPRGHKYTPENTRTTKQGWRYCVACKREKSRARRVSHAS